MGSEKKYCNTWTDSCRDYLISGLPGVGKTYFIENHVIEEILNLQGKQEESEESNQQDKPTRVERFIVTESSTHEDFYGAFMPKMDGDNVTYEFIPGPAARIIKNAIKDEKEDEKKEKKNYVLLVENINCGNAYEIFGDLFQLFDRDGNNRSKYKVSLSEDVKTWLKDEGLSDTEKLYLPENLYIICTMTESSNVAYRLDTAFRRRFKMVYITEDGTVYGNIPNNIQDEVTHSDDSAKYTEVIFDTKECYISSEWKELREKFNENITAEDKQFTEHFLKMVDVEVNENKEAGEKEKRIAIIDFVIAIYSHFLENVYVNDEGGRAEILNFSNLKDALDALKNKEDGKNAEEIIKPLFKIEWN